MSLHPGQTLLSKYKIIELLGSGGWGEVYLAEDNLGREVAVKCLRKDLYQDESALSQYCPDTELV